MLKLSDIERNLQDLPVLPATVMHILTLRQNDEDYFEKLLKLSQEDPAFALRIIKVANSAANAPRNPIKNLQGAIARLGTQQVGSLITSFAVMRVFIPTTQGENNLWAHAMQVAVASRFIGHAALHSNVNPEQAYLCGLLHDIGRFVLFEKARNELDKIDEMNWKSPIELVKYEQEIYGFDHSEVGGHVCNHWQLPKTIRDVVANHHVYDLPEQLSKDNELASLIRVVQLADFFSVFMLLNPDFLSWEPKLLAQNLVDKCILPCSSEAPIDATELQTLAPRICEMSEKLCVDLGIDTK